MNSYKVTGKPLSGRKNKQTLVVDASSKTEIWNYPEDFGFHKIFKVDEVKGVVRGNQGLPYDT